MPALAMLVESLVDIKSRGWHVVLVTSGAIAVGMRALNLREKPEEIESRQALAALGQGRLMSIYDNLFAQYDQRVGQVLFTRKDLAEKSNYFHACNTLNTLLDMGAIPIINENDTVSTFEIKFGNNDTLAAIAAGMVKADWLFLLTDVDALYSDDPRRNPAAEPIMRVTNIRQQLRAVNYESGGSAIGTGGMSTKIEAANLCSSAGINCVISSAEKPNRMMDIIKDISIGEPRNSRELPLLYTYFEPQSDQKVDRRWWILHTLQPVSNVVPVGEDLYVEVLAAESPAQVKSPVKDADPVVEVGTRR